jgi:hypothetical protein
MIKCPDCDKELEEKHGYGDCAECKIIVINW